MLSKIYTKWDADTFRRGVISWYRDINLSKAIAILERELKSPNELNRESAASGFAKIDFTRRNIAVSILLSRLKTETSPAVRGTIAVILATYDLGIVALRIIDEEAKNFHPTILLRRLSKTIGRLHPDGSVSREEIELLNRIVLKERNLVNKAYMISVLAANGQTEKAVEYTSALIYPYFFNSDTKQEDAEELVLAMGRIGDPRIKDLLLSVYGVRPELAPEIAHVFVKQGFRDKRITDKLFEILADENQPSDRRQYSALFLVEMGEL